MSFLDDRCAARGDGHARGARTIAGAAGRGSRFPARLLLFVCGCVLGCAGPRENSLHRAARLRAADRLTTARDEASLQHQLLSEEQRELERTNRELRDRVAGAAQRRRELERDLAGAEREADAVAAALAAVRARLQTDSAAHQELLAAVADVQQKEQRLAALRAQSEQAAAQIAAAEQAIAALQPRLDGARQRLEQARAIDSELQKALQAIGGLASPPAAPAPAAAPPAVAPK